MNTRRLIHSLRFRSADQHNFQLLMSRPGVQLSTSRIVLAGILTLLSSSFFPITALVLIAIFLCLVAIGMALLNGFFQGILIAMQISYRLAKIREQGSYDLLCTLPGGAVLTNWTIGAAYLRQAQILKQLDSQTVWIIRVLFSIMMIFIAARSHTTPWGGPVLALIQFLTLTLAFYLDDSQSITLSCFVGLLSPTYTSNPAEARLRALISYLSLQIFIYFATLITVFTFIPTIAHLLQAIGAITYFSQAIFGLLCLYTLREGIISIVWRILFHRLEAVPADNQTLKTT